LIDHGHLTISSLLKIYTYPLFLTYRREKNALVIFLQSGTGQKEVRLLILVGQMNRWSW